VFLKESPKAGRQRAPLNRPGIGEAYDIDRVAVILSSRVESCRVVFLKESPKPAKVREVVELLCLACNNVGML